MLHAREASVYPLIFLGQLPDTPQARRQLRERALDLHERFQAAPAPTYLLLNAALSGGEPPLDLLLLRPELILAGTIYECAEPIDMLPDGQWVARESGARLSGHSSTPPPDQIRRLRALACQRIARYAPQMPDADLPEAALRRTIGALIFAPVSAPDSRIALDVDDHREQIKVLGLDELPALADMARLDIALPEPAMRALLVEGFGARLWHDGARLLFEPAYAPLRLRLLDERDTPHTLRLIEGTNVIGRRPAPLKHEYRLIIPGDDLMSNDHALLICTLDGRTLLRDTSTNGTWITPPGGVEERVHRADRELRPGALIRLGMTQLRLERNEDDSRDQGSGARDQDHEPH